jgi:hypothetical protein
MKFSSWTLVVSLPFLFACSSTPKVERPAWLNEPTRVVDNGYIVYVGTAEDLQPEKAQFKAEGIALEDLANECSFIPKGARIEDRFQEKNDKLTKSYVKLGLEFTECEKAKHTTDPVAIKEIANVAFAEQMRKFQDLSETGEVPDKSQYAALEVPKEWTPAPARAGMSEDVHFYAVRQYVAYQKEVVILSPPMAYAPNSVETQRYTAAVQPAVAQVETYQAKNPELAKNPLPISKLPNRMALARPAVLTPHLNREGFKPIPADVRRHEQSHGASPKPRKKKRRH